MVKFSGRFWIANSEDAPNNKAHTVIINFFFIVFFFWKFKRIQNSLKIIKCEFRYPFHELVFFAYGFLNMSSNSMSGIYSFNAMVSHIFINLPQKEFYWDFKIFNYIWPALRTGVCKLLNS